MRLRDDIDDEDRSLASAIAGSGEPMPRETRDAVRARLMEAVRPQSVPLHVRLLRPALALGTAGALLGGVSYAAAVSRPGDALYGVKTSVVQAVRATRASLTRTTPGKASHGSSPVTPLEQAEPAHIERVVPKTLPATRAVVPGRSEATGTGGASPKGASGANGKAVGRDRDGSDPSSNGKGMSPKAGTPDKSGKAKSGSSSKTSGPTGTGKPASPSGSSKPSKSTKSAKPGKSAVSSNGATAFSPSKAR